MSNERVGREAAEAFRNEFALGIDPIANMARLIEKKTGVGVAYVATSEPGHGMTMRLDDRYLMAVGCTEHPMRLRSTLAHELGHFRLGSVDRTLDQEDWDSRRPEEIQADAFARHLLVPLAVVTPPANSGDVSPAWLSELVQKYQASPSIVSIQLRDAGVIDHATYSEWSGISAGRLAARFGWHKEYASLAAETRTTRAPQALLARAIEGYRWGIVTPATISRLDGGAKPEDVVEQLTTVGIVPQESDYTVPERPSESGLSLTAEELDLLMGDVD